MDKKIVGFTVIVQYHDQPPIDAQAYRPVKAREFLPGISLAEVWKWVNSQRGYMSVESVKICPLTVDDTSLGG